MDLPIRLLPKPSFLFPLFLTAAFFAISVVGILHHELWLDEAQGFLVCKESSSILDLWRNTKQEAHPILWFVMVWLLTKCTHDIFCFQLLSVFISSVTVFLLARYAPFNKLKKVLFVFSYFFFYEYTIISRNYGLCVLLVTIFCILLSAPKKRVFLLFFVLVLLANTHFLGLLLSLPLALAAVIVYGNANSHYTSVNSKEWILPVAMLLIGYFICIEHVVQDETSALLKFEHNEYLSVKRLSAFTVILKALFQFPFLDGITWNTNIFTQNKFVGMLLTPLVLFACVKAFSGKPLSFIIFFSTVLFFSVFFYLEFMYKYTVRHWGFVFMGFYVAIWLAEGVEQEKLAQRLQNYIPGFLERNSRYWRETLLYSSLIVQVLASVYTFAWDYKNPFSNAKAVADYLKQQNYAEELIIVSTFSSGVSISAYLDKQLYYPEYHGYGSYARWNTWPVFISGNALQQEIEVCKKEGHKMAILVLNHEMYERIKINTMSNDTMKAELLKTFKEGNDDQDRYEVYKIVL